MDERLFDTSTFFDVQRAPKHSRAEWAQTTLRHYGTYRAHHPRLTISALTLFETMEGSIATDDGTRPKTSWLGFQAS